MKYYLIAGEASGDLHGSNLIKSLKKEDSNAIFVGWGGDLMEAEGMQLKRHFKEVAFMGFIEVIKHLPTILKAIKTCKKDILQEKPDVIILIDYPGFNLRIAEFAKNEGLKLFYYISPQVWAWKESRVKKMKQNIEHMMVILPFEKTFFEERGMPVEFVGHPLIDALSNFNKEDESKIKSGKPIVALLPGSRKQEISNLLELMLQVKKAFPNYDFVIGGAPSVEESFYRSIVGNECRIVFNQTYQLMSEADYALTASGTATLETALFNVPEVVCFKGNALSYWIARSLVKVKYISLVNLVVDRPLVKELIQYDCTVENMVQELDLLMNDAKRKEEIQFGYKELREKLGGGGASERCAKYILKNS